MGAMAEEIVFHAEPFVDVCNRLYSKWKGEASEEAWGQNCDALVIAVGSNNDEQIVFHKSLSLHAACFQMELYDTLFAFCEDKIIALGASKKAKLLQELSTKLPDTFKYKLQVLTRDKTDKDKANFETILAEVKGDKQGVKVGVLSKEKHIGDFYLAWHAALAEAPGFSTADVSGGIADVLVVKGKVQLSAARGAGQCAASMMKKTMIEKLLDVVDQETPTKMLNIAEQVEKELEKIAASCEPKLDPADTETRVLPLVQSGGGYDLRWNAQTEDKEQLHLPGRGIPAVFVAGITVHHRLCCSTVVRTLMFNAKKDQMEAYKTLFEVFDECLQEIKPGIPMRRIYDIASARLKERDSKLAAALYKELGWALGYELRDKRYVLDEKNKALFQAGMLVCLRIGLEGLTTTSKDEKGKKYSLLLADTVIVTAHGIECLTEGVQRKPKRVQWTIGDEEAEGKKEEKRGATKEEIARRLKEEELRQKHSKMTDEMKQKEREEYEQRNDEIAKRRLEEQIRRRNQGGDEIVKVDRKQTTDYTETDDYPTKAFGHGKTYTQLCVDEKGMTLFVPVNGVPVPFHVSCIRSAQLQTAEGGAVLRVNFTSPGGGGLVPGTFDKRLSFLREISYKATDMGNLQMVHKSISEMRKQFTQAEKERQAEAEVESQPALKIDPNRGPRLQNVRVYPNLQARGRKTEGDLEAHINGFRFTAKKDKNNAALAPSSRTIDIIYRNVKHAFLQPSNRHSTLVLLHLRLVSPIMINKSAHKDVQFYLEMEDGESLLDNKRRNHLDKDEIEEEEKHRKVLAKIDKEFKNFCDKVHQKLPPLSKSDPDGDKIWDWDVPYVELMFQGSPKNQMIELYPTVNCIVHLASKPVFIAEMEEIDMVYYERVKPGGGNFDLSLIYKKFLNQNPPPKFSEGGCWERIGTIDMKFLDNVKEVLQKSSIPQYEGTTTMNWTNILKDYNKNFEDISADGGWKVLFGKDSDDEDDDDEEEDDEDFSAGGDSEDDSEEDESSDDYSEASEEDSDDYSEEELSSEGMDSDEAEAWAEEEDKRAKHLEKKRGGEELNRPPPKKSKGGKVMLTL